MQLTQPEVERRKARRFTLEVPVVFRWAGDGQTACEGAGFCRDISINGLFVIAFSAVPPLGRKLDLMVLLPPLNPKAPALRLCSSGSVVRLEPSEEGVGVGIISAFGDFENPDHPASSLSMVKAAFPCS